MSSSSGGPALDPRALKQGSLPRFKKFSPLRRTPLKLDEVLEETDTCDDHPEDGGVDDRDPPPPPAGLEYRLPS